MLEIEEILLISLKYGFIIGGTVSIIGEGINLALKLFNS